MESWRDEIIKNLKKAGLPLRKRTAEEIRQLNIRIYQDSLRLPKCFAASCDAPYYIKAYEMMTGREILASEKKFYEVAEKEFSDYREKHRYFKEESRKTRIVARVSD